MDIILYFSWIKLKSIFDPKIGIWKMIGFIALLIASGLYSLAIGYGLNHLGNEISHTDIMVIKKSIFVGMFIMPLFTFYFPVYRTLVTWFHPFHPAKALVRYTTNLMSDLISKNYLFFLTLSLPLLIASGYFDIIFIIKILISLTSAFVFRRIFQSFIQFKFELSGMNLLKLIMSLIILVIIALSLFWLKFDSIQGYFAAFTLLLISGFIIEEKVSKNIRHKDEKVRTGIVYQWSLLWRNKKVKTALIMAMLFKGFFMFMLFVSQDSPSIQEKDSIFSNPVMIAMFFSPLVLFTYVFNNTWGYYSNLWLLICNSTSSGISLFKQQMQLMVIPVLIDATSSLIVFFFIGEHIMDNIIMYFGSLTILTFTSYFWSIRFAKRVNSTVMMRSNSNMLAAFASISLIGGLYSLRISNWFYMLIPIYLLLGIYLHLSMNSYYSKKIVYVYQKLFKNT